MKQKIPTLLLLLSSLSLADVAATSQDMRAFVLPKDTLSMRGAYLLSNDTIDILNINNKSALGDSSGVNFNLGYGAQQFFSLYYNFEALNIHYAHSKIKNRKNELYARVNFYDSPHYSFDDFSMDVGYIHNSADDFNHLSNLSDNSYYLRLLLGSKFTTALLNFYTGVKYTAINTTHDASNQDRHEKTLMLGTSYTQEFSHYILDAQYEYLHMFGRGSALDETKSNHQINLNLSRTINKDFLIYIGTKVMFKQFNGTIPYLYNAQTQSDFDKTYILTNLGFVYNFTLSDVSK